MQDKFHLISLNNYIRDYKSSGQEVSQKYFNLNQTKTSSSSLLQDVPEE